MSDISFIFKIDDYQIIKYGKIIGLDAIKNLIDDNLDKTIRHYVINALNDYYKKKYSRNIKKLFIGIIGTSNNKCSIDESEVFNLYIIIKDDKMNFTYNE